jgi:hypothetical protein
MSKLDDDIIDKLTTAAVHGAKQADTRLGLRLELTTDGVKVAGSMSVNHPSAVLTHKDKLLPWKDVLEDRLIPAIDEVVAVLRKHCA